MGGHLGRLLFGRSPLAAACRPSAHNVLNITSTHQLPPGMRPGRWSRGGGRRRRRHPGRGGEAAQEPITGSGHGVHATGALPEGWVVERCAGVARSRPTGRRTRRGARRHAWVPGNRPRTGGSWWSACSPAVTRHYGPRGSPLPALTCTDAGGCVWAVPGKGTRARCARTAVRERHRGLGPGNRRWSTPGTPPQRGGPGVAAPSV